MILSLASGCTQIIGQGNSTPGATVEVIGHVYEVPYDPIKDLSGPSDFALTEINHARDAEKYGDESGGSGTTAEYPEDWFFDSEKTRTLPWRFLGRWSEVGCLYVDKLKADDSTLTITKEAICTHQYQVTGCMTLDAQIFKLQFGETNEIKKEFKYSICVTASKKHNLKLSIQSGVIEQSQCVARNVYDFWHNLIRREEIWGCASKTDESKIRTSNSTY